MTRLWRKLAFWRRPRCSGDLVVSYVDGGEYFGYHEEAIRRALHPALVTFERRASRPDVLVGSVFGRTYRLAPSRVPRLLFVGEPGAHAKRTSDYDLVVHTVRGYGDHVHIPFYVSSFGERRHHRPADLVKTADRVREALPSKSRFCAFLYRNRYARREELFDLLAEVHPVDALGRARSADGRGRDDRNVHTPDITYNDLAVEAYRPYKFVICGENSLLPGYVTEKIVSAMLAYAIPIYLGAPDIGEHFNPRSFLDAGRMSPEEVLAAVRRLDSDDDAYAAMLAEPWLHGNVLPAIFQPNEELIARLRGLFR